MKRFGLYSLIVAIAVFSTVSVAQHRIDVEAPPEPEKSENPKLIDEFGRLPECDLRGRYDIFLAELAQNPDTQGFMLVYQGADVLPASYDSPAAERMFRNHIMFRAFDPSRMTIVNAGFREEGSTQLWIVPPGAVPPSPENSLPKPEIPTNNTFLFDRDYLALEEEGPESSEFVLDSVKAELEAERLKWEEEDRLERLAAGEQDVDVEPALDEEPAEIEEPDDEAEVIEEEEDDEEYKFHWLSASFGNLLAAREESSGVIIFYADDERFDIQKIRGLIAEGVEKLAETASLKPGRIEVIFGGYRSSTDVDYWIVPKDGSPPVATREERPVEEPEETGGN